MLDTPTTERACDGPGELQMGQVGGVVDIDADGVAAAGSVQSRRLTQTCQHWCADVVLRSQRWTAVMSASFQLRSK